MNLKRDSVKSQVFAHLASLSMGCAASLITLAFDFFLLPHGPEFAPEIGLVGSYLFSSIFCVFILFVEFIFIGTPVFFSMRKWRSGPNRFGRALILGAVVSLTLPLGNDVIFGFTSDGLLLAVAIGFISGFVYSFSLDSLYARKSEGAKGSVVRQGRPYQRPD